MARAARSLGGELRGRIDVAAEGGRWSLALVAVLAVGREGLETALFLWAATQAGTRDTAVVTPTWEPLLGAALGLLTAVVLGYLIYRGAISINLTRFFTWTGGFLIVVAAGVLAYGVHDLQEAGFLPGLNNLAFDVSDTIDVNSWYGALLKGVFNFCPATTKLEAAAWLLYVIPVLTLFLRSVRRRRRTHQPRPTSRSAPPARAEPADPDSRRAQPCARPSSRPPWRPRCRSSPRAPERRHRRRRRRRREPAVAHRRVHRRRVQGLGDQAPAGTLTFEVTNTGSQVTEFYLLDADGLRIVAEVENIGPGLNPRAHRQRPGRHLLHRLQAGMKGEGIRADFTVTESGDGGRRAGARTTQAPSTGRGALRGLRQGPGRPAA